MIQTTKVFQFVSVKNIGRAMISSFALLAAFWAMLSDNCPQTILQAAPLSIPPSEVVNANTTYDGGTWTGTNTLTINSPATATLSNGNTFTFSGNSGATINGGGVLSNEGVFDHNATNTYLIVNALTNFINQSNGVLNMNNTGSRIHLNGGGNGNVHNYGGTININAANTRIDGNGVFTTFDGGTLHDLNLNINSGSFLLDATGTGGQISLNLPAIPSGSSVRFNTPSVMTNSGTGDLNFAYDGSMQFGNFAAGTNVILNSVEGHTINGGTWNSGGFNTTLETGRTVDLTGNVLTYTGGGTFFNKGTFNHSLNFGQYWVFNGTSVFENTGTLNMTGPGSRIHLNGGGNGNFHNFGGTINVSAPGGRIDGNGVFTTWDGSTLHDLNLNIISGDFSLDATAAGGQISLNLPAVPSGSFVRLNTPSVMTKAGGGDLNFNFDGSMQFGNFTAGANVILDAAEGHTVSGGTWNSGGFNTTLETGRTLDLNGNVLTYTGGGTFANKGTFNNNLNFGQYWVFNGTSVFENTGTLNLDGDGARIHLNGGGNGNIHNYGGTINVNSPNARIDGNGVFTTFDGSTLHDLNLNINSGNFWLEATGSGGQISLNMSDIPSGSVVRFSTPSVFTNAGGGDLNFNVSGAMQFGHFGMGTNVILDAAEGHTFLGGGTMVNNGFDMTLETGRMLLIDGNVTNFSGTGKFYNKGDITQDTNSGQYFLIHSGLELVNTGTYNMTSENARIHRNGGAGGDINNQGMFTKDATTTLAFIDGAAGSFKNTGTVFVPGGELELRDGTLLSYSGGTLNEGTWIVDSTATGAAVLDLQPAGAGINIIGAAADVQLIGTGADLVQLTSTFAGLDGKLKLSEGKQLNVNLLGMGSTAELTLGLGSLSATNSMINVNGDLTANGLINIEDLGGLEVGVYDLISFNGLFTDNGIALGSLPSLFDDPSFTANLLVPDSGVTGGIIQLSIGLVPEPGTASLLGLGMLGLMNFRRRKRSELKV